MAKSCLSLNMAGARESHTQCLCYATPLYPGHLTGHHKDSQFGGGRRTFKLCLCFERVSRFLHVYYCAFTFTMSANIKQEYVELNDSINDDESDDENGMEVIFDYVNDSVKKGKEQIKEF